MVVIAGLALGLFTWVTFVVAGVVGLVVGIPAGLWNTKKVRRDDPDWKTDRHIPA